MATNRGVAFRLFVMMVLQVGAWGAWAPKLFPYMQMLGLTAGEQSLVGSCWGIAAIVGIFGSNQFADRRFAAERFLAASHAISALCLFGAAFSDSFWPLFLCFLGYSLVFVPTLSVANAMAFANLRDPARQFGAIRAGGTVGWILASWPFIFLLDAHATIAQVRWIFIVSAMISLALAIYALTLPHTPPRPAGTQDPLAWRRVLALLRQPFVAVLFLVTLIDSIIHNGYFIVADAFLTNRVGIAGNLSMVVLSLGQSAEIIAMLILGRVLTRLGWRATMTIGILGHVLRYLIFSFAADNIPIIILSQLLHGICYSFFFATLYVFIDEVFPDDVRVSSQGLFNFLILGAGMVIASFVFPLLVSALSHSSITAAGPTVTVDYHRLFLVPAALAAVAALLMLFAFRPPTSGPGRIGRDAS